MANPNSRNLTVDLMRSGAIGLMVVFHFIFDLKITGYHQLDIPDGEFWVRYRNLTLSLFMSCVGIGLAMAHQSGIRWRPYWKRLARIVGAAGLVTAMSLMMFPNAWIYFGVLHFIAVASLLCLPLARHPRLALLCGVALLTPHLAGLTAYGWPLHYLAEWLPSYTYDFVTPLPWLGVVCLGAWLGHQPWFRRDPLRRLPGAARLGLPGRHSLAIYLLHQPLLLGALWLISRLIPPHGSAIF